MHGQVSALNLKTSYRPDIDGLRAIAVLSVLTYHYSASSPLPLVPGGFIGVDVFFVISGFLITSNLRDEIAAGTFSVLGFYDRRVRRILPALIAMLAATLLAGKFLLMPGDYKALADSTAAAAFGVSNFFFLANTGYFDQSADLMPLLHTWSLAVEEQFYLVWPPLLFAITAGRKRIDVAAMAGAVVIAGFGASLFWFDADPKGAFFLAAPRAWELAIGATLAFLPALPRAIGEVATIAGLLLIGAGFVLVSATSFPGVAALYPCLGAALVIWPRRTPTAAASWLGLLSPIGLISYSLYLWHWPVWVLFRVYVNNSTPTIGEAAALAAISILIAALSHRFVERPFRKWHPKPAQTVWGALAACMFIFCGAMYIDSKEGMPERFPADIAAMRSLDAMWEWPCGLWMGLPEIDRTVCVFGAPWQQAQTKGVLWGDSHAMHFAPIMEMFARKHRASMMLYEQCLPIADNRIVHYDQYDSRPDIKKYCIANREQMIAALKAHPEINLVVLAASWANIPGSLYLGDDASARDPTKGAALFEEALSDTIKQIQGPGRRIAIMTSVPQWGHDPLPCEMIGSNLYRRTCPAAERAIPRRLFDSQLATTRMISEVAAQNGAVVISVGERMCPGKWCVAELGGEPLYRDASHIRRNLPEETKWRLGEMIGLDEIFH
jgi:peptidoglycan/LPS O-acetylase OafA/YrhL